MNLPLSKIIDSISQTDSLQVDCQKIISCLYSPIVNLERLNEVIDFKSDIKSIVLAPYRIEAAVLNSNIFLDDEDFV